MIFLPIGQKIIRFLKFSIKIKKEKVKEELKSRRNEDRGEMKTGGNEDRGK